MEFAHMGCQARYVTEYSTTIITSMYITLLLSGKDVQSPDVGSKVP